MVDNSSRVVQISQNSIVPSDVERSNAGSSSQMSENTITLTGENLYPVADMINEMREKGTFRSKAGLSTSEKIGMWLSGKGAEIAFSRFLEVVWDVSTKVDTRAYDDVKADQGDLWQVQTDDGDWVEAEPVEVKKTMHYANHVAITRSEMRQIGAEEPIVYVTTDWEPDPPTDSDALREWLSGQEIEFKVVGWCKPNDLRWVEQGAKPWTKLEDNKCQPFSQMRDDWRKFATLLGDTVSARHDKWDFSG